METRVPKATLGRETSVGRPTFPPALSCARGRYTHTHTAVNHAVLVVLEYSDSLTRHGPGTVPALPHRYYNSTRLPWRSLGCLYGAGWVNPSGVSRQP